MKKLATLAQNIVSRVQMDFLDFSTALHLSSHPYVANAPREPIEILTLKLMGFGSSKKTVYRVTPENTGAFRAIDRVGKAAKAAPLVNMLQTQGVLAVQTVTMNTVTPGQRTRVVEQQPVRVV
jgi:hypothetical protein